ncbi:MAG: RsmE family RNA methyltransferase, partial [Bacilli bacterium]
MQRYFIDQVVKAKEIKIKDSDYHHIKNVMRMVKDDLIEIVDLDGFIYLGRILDFNNKEVTIAIEEKLLENNELNIEVTLALGLVNRNKTEEVLRRAVELGANKFLSVKLKRSVIKHIDDKLDRKEKIVKEASEQSKRSKLMAIEETKTLKELIEYSKDYDLRICCYE